MYLKSSYLFLLLSLILCACAEKAPKASENIQAYYYPIQDLQQAQIYEYSEGQDPRDTSQKVKAMEYWKMQSYQQDAKQLLRFTLYNPGWEKSMENIEQELSNGVVNHQLQLFVKDSNDVVKIHPVELEPMSVLFPYEAKLEDSLIYHYKSTFRSPADSNDVLQIVRERSLVNVDTVYKFANKDYPAVVLQIREYRDLSNAVTGGVWKWEYRIEEIYAKSIGLVQKRTERIDEIEPVKYLHLSAIYNAEETKEIEQAFQLK